MRCVFCTIFELRNDEYGALCAVYADAGACGDRGTGFCLPVKSVHMDSAHVAGQNGVQHNSLPAERMGRTIQRNFFVSLAVIEFRDHKSQAQAGNNGKDKGLDRNVIRETAA